MSQIIRPSPVAYKDIDLSWMVARSVSKISFQEPTPWTFDFGSEAHIGIECLWRIVEHGRVVLTSEDHGQQFGLPAPIDGVAKATQLFSDRRVRGVQLREGTADLLIEFIDDLRLEVIPDSSGYESWELHDPAGTSYYAQGGGQICIWKPCRLTFKGM